MIWDRAVIKDAVTAWRPTSDLLFNQTCALMSISLVSTLAMGIPTAEANLMCNINYTVNPLPRQCDAIHILFDNNLTSYNAIWFDTMHNEIQSDSTQYKEFTGLHLVFKHHNYFCFLSLPVKDLYIFLIKFTFAYNHSLLHLFRQFLFGLLTKHLKTHGSFTDRHLLRSLKCYLSVILQCFRKHL